MNIQSAVQLIVQVLQYVLPAVFLWAITDTVVKRVVKAASGKGWGI